MSIVLQSSGGGSVTLQEPSTASNVTVTIPAATGTVMVNGNMPAFIAYGNADQAISDSTATKIQYNIEVYDTANCYDTSNYRFTPNVAGYYWVHAFFEYQGQSPAGNTLYSAWIYKNGSQWKRAQFQAALGGNWKAEVQSLMYMNGSTDYIEIYTYQNFGSSRTVYNSNGQIYNGFEATLVRAA
jgi:protoporphyrinogen oxidase